MKQSPTFCWFGLVFICASLLLPPASHQAFAQDFKRSIRIIVPSAPGGSLDFVARVVANGIGPKLGEPLIVENISGAGGQIAWRTAARAEPDGHTILVEGPSLITTPLTQKGSYNVLPELRGLSGGVRYALMLLASSKVPANTFQEFVDLAKKSPEKYTYGVSGVGGYLHVGVEAISALAEIKLRPVPYRGSAPALQDLISGQIDIFMTGLPSDRATLSKNGVRILAVTSGSRIPAFPDVPTVSEFSPNFSLPYWISFFVPRGTPDDVVAKLSSVFLSTLADPDVRQRLSLANFTADLVTADEVDAFVNAEDSKMRVLVQKSGITPN